jgi:uncharacterized iron-regulated protein
MIPVRSTVTPGNMLSGVGQRVALIACALALIGCAALDAAQEAVRPGRIWHTQTQRFVGYQQLAREVRNARIVLLGEKHDNPEHHRLQLRLLRELIDSGRRPALVMEQFDREHQTALDAERARARHTVDSIMEAGGLKRGGWDVEGYRPLIALALEHALPLVAANVSRTDARAIVREPLRAALPAVDATVEKRLAVDIERGHCGRAIEPTLLAGMVAAQRARDVAMAQALARYAATPDGAVLIAGSGHVQADRGVPLYLPTRPLVVAFVETDRDQSSERDDLLDEPASRTRYDYVWFTEPAHRADPCK